MSRPSRHGLPTLSLCLAGTLAGTSLAHAALFPAQIDVADLRPENGADGSQGLVLVGVADGDQAGVAVAARQDFNSDGIDDILIGANEYDYPERNRSGGAFVIYGSADFGASFELEQLTPALDPDGSLGVLVYGAGSQVRIGETAADGGDLSGDGIDDLLFAAPDQGTTGVSFLLNGFQGEPPFPFGALIDADELNFFSIGSTFIGSVPGDSPPVPQEEMSGTALANVGDVNGDGFDDLGIGGPGAALPSVPRPQAVGRAYVVFGPTSELLNTNDLLAITPGGGNDGSRGFVVDGYFQFSTVGTAITAAGDLNNDGVDDVAVGANGLGQVFVIYGSSSFNPARYDVRQFSPGVNDGRFGFLIESVTEPAALGAELLGGVDFNQDGISDLVLAASRGFGAPSEVFILYGRDGNFDPAVDLSDLRNGDGSQGVYIVGAPGDERSLTALSSGDLNNDGLPDLVIGAGGDGNPDGRAYVLFGQVGGFAPTVLLSALLDGDGSAGFVVVGSAGAGERVGTSVSAGGDVNGDGLQDLVVGAPESLDTGAAYVVYGRADSDGDGIADGNDNCTLVANTPQRDSNGDGYGNACDADLDDNCIVNAQDWFIMRERIGTDDADADLNGDGVVNGIDALTLFQNRFAPPGPSGITDACD